MNGMAVARRASFLLGREDQVLFPANIRMIDDPHLARGLRIVLEENIGDVVCEARSGANGLLRAVFEVPRLPARVADLPDIAAVADYAAGLH